MEDIDTSAGQDDPCNSDGFLYSSGFLVPVNVIKRPQNSGHVYCVALYGQLLIHFPVKLEHFAVLYRHCINPGCLDN